METKLLSNILDYLNQTVYKTLIIFVFGFLGFSPTQTFAAVGITPPSLTVSNCGTLSTTYTTLGNIVITEGVNTDFAVGTNLTLILTAPANFEFQPTTGIVTYGSNNISGASITISANTITITYTVGGTNKIDVLTISGIKVRGINVASGPSNITRTGGSGIIAGDAVGQSHGTLTSQVFAVPSVTTANTALTCSGTGPNIILAASVASTFTWALGTNTGGITGASAGSGSPINQVLTNPSNTTAGSIVYIVTPVSTANSCTGAAYSITVTVNPKPVVTTLNTAVICSGNGPNINLTASKASTFTWTVGTITGGITGASAGSGSNINQTLVNPSNSVSGSVVYAVTPTTTTDLCTGTPYSITVTVNPRPTAALSGTTTICNGATTNLTLSVTGPGTITGTLSNGATFSGTAGTINVSVAPSATTTYTITSVTNGTCASDAADISGTATVTVNPRPTAVLSGTTTICNGAAATLSLAVTGAGTISGTLSNGAAFSGTAGTITVSVSPSATTTYTIATLTNGTCTSIAADLTGSAVVTVNPRPTAVLSGTTTICNGSSTMLSLAITGPGTISGTLSDGTNFSGSAPTILVSVNPTVSTTYSISSLTNGTCVSIPADRTGSAIVTVNDPILITSQPNPLTQTICSGNTVSYSVTATGTGPLTYQWYKGATALVNGTRITGATSQTLNLLFVNVASSTSAGNEYYVKISSPAPCGPVNSAKLELTVNTEIIITAQPILTQTVCEGSNATITATAEGTGPFTVEWYKGAAQILTGISTVVNSATSITTTLTLTNLSIADQSNEYYAIIKNPANVCPQEVSNESALIVNPTSKGGNVSANQTICSGTTPASLTLSDQTGTVTKWQKSTVSDFSSAVTDIASTSTTLTGALIGALTTTTYFRAVVQSGVCSEANSSTVTITIDPLSVGGMVSSSQTICIGGTPADLTLSGQTGMVTKWQRSTVSTFLSAVTDIPVTTNTLSSATIGAISVTTYFRAVVQSGVCSVANSSSVTITVDPISVGGTVSADQTICIGSTPAALTLSGQTGTVTKWQKSTVSNFSSATDIASTSTTLTGALIGPVSVTTYIRALVQSGNCANTPSSSITINITPLSAGGTVTASQSICTGGTPASLILFGQTGVVTKWQRSTVSDFSSAVTDIAVTTNTLTAASIGALTTTTYFRAVVQSGSCALANSSVVTITVTPLSVAGTLSPVKAVGCEGTASGTITLSGYVGTILRWEFSENAGNTWSPIVNATTTHTYTNLIKTTIYRAVIQSGNCGSVNSSVSIIVVDPKFTPVITANPPVACVGQPVTFTATGYQSLGTLSGGDFADANPPGWSGSNANNSGADPNSIWGEANGPRAFNGVTYNSTGKFMIVNGTTGAPGNISILSTPVFSTVGLSTAVLTWRQAYNLNAGTVAKVEISLDGGATYNTLITYTGIANQGPTNGLAAASINLDAYLGQTNLKVRFHYTGTAGSNWAIDDVNMSNSYTPLTYSWTAPDGSTSSGTTLTVIPTVAGTQNYTVSTTTASSCPGAGSGTIALIVNPAATLGGVSIAPACSGQNMTVILTGMLPNSVSSLTYKMGSNANVILNGVAANASGVASFTVLSNIANNGQSFDILSLTSAIGSNASCSITPTTNNKATLSISTGYVWTGLGANNNWSNAVNWTSCGVPPYGSSVTIPQVSNSNFPKMDVVFASNDFDLQGTATLDINGFLFQLGNSPTSAITTTGSFIGSPASRLVIYGALSLPLKFVQTTVGVSNSLLSLSLFQTGTVTIGNPLYIIGNVIPNSGILSSAGNLTMVSTATTSSNINSFSAPTDVTGDVNVQSYITGDGISLANRGFRSMSSPINDALISGNKTYRQLKDYIIVTGPGGITNGFNAGGAAQPYAETIVYYNETAPALSPSFQTISTINDANVPGTGFLTFFRGSQGGDGSANNISKLNAPFAAPNAVTVTYKGPINKYNLPLITLKNSSQPGDAYNGYNLVGNPYPSSIEWNEVFSRATGGVLNTFTIVLPGGKQASYLDGVFNNLATTVIQPGQGFYARTSVNGGTISFKESSKTATYPARLLSIPQSVLMSTGPLAFEAPYKISNIRKLLRLNLRDGQNKDETTLVFQEKNSMFSGYEDALYFSGSTVTLASISSDNKNMAINGLPEIAEVKEIRLNVNATKSGEFKLSFTDLDAADGYMVWLKDSLHSANLIDVRVNPEYSFSIDKSKPTSYGNKRFSILLEPRPTELIAFTAKQFKKEVNLKWNIKQGLNIPDFELERSPDSIQFTSIQLLKGGPGQLYSFVDKDPLNGANYYRLKIIDRNLVPFTSNIVKANLNMTNLDSTLSPVISLFPNPAKEEYNLEFNMAVMGDIQVNMYDVNGQKVKSATYSVNGKGLINQNISDIKSGVYLVEIIDFDSKLVLTRLKLIKYN